MERRNVLQFVPKALGIAIPIMAIVFVLDVPLYLTGASLFNQQYMALFWSLIVALIFLTVPASKKGVAKRPRWYDWLLVVLTFIVGFYVTIFYPQILRVLGVVAPLQVVMGSLAVLLVLESTRRVAGWPIVIIVVIFILYAKFGNLIPGILQTKGLSWARLLSQLYLGADFMLGTPLKIASLIVFGFIFFGQVIFQTGGGEFLMKLAQSLMGRYRGGPAKVAVLASSLFGTVSGSAVANVATTGMVTIPLMKKSGYSSTYAGAIEATASTAGQIMPPVMGAAAFVMAEFLGVSYPTVVLVAIVPAMLYYLGVYLQIDLQAASSGLKGLPREEIPSFKETLRQGWIFIVPLIVLIITLFILFLPPGVAALYSTGALVLVTMLKKDIRDSWSWSKISSILQGTSRSLFELIAITAAAGFVVGIVSYTGLGLSLSRVLTEVAGGNLLLLALLTAITSTILGMGMPTTAAYILLAVLAAPALVSLGIEPVLAHLFVFYYGTLSMITPPVCLAAYTAASIAKAPQMPLAFRSMRLAVAAYIVPFIFLYMPGLALIGSVWEIILAIFLTVIAIILFAVVIEGYFLRKLTLLERCLFFVAGITMVVPNWYTHLIGLAIAAVVFLLHIRSRKRLEG